MYGQKNQINHMFSDTNINDQVFSPVDPFTVSVHGHGEPEHRVGLVTGMQHPRRKVHVETRARAQHQQEQHYGYHPSSQGLGFAPRGTTTVNYTHYEATRKLAASIRFFFLQICGR